MSINPRALWDNCLQLIKDNVSEQQFNTWFRPIVFKSYKPATRTILVGIPSMFVYEYLEENYVDLLKKTLTRFYGEGTKLNYSVLTDKQNNITQSIEGADAADIEAPRPKTRGNQSPTVLDAVKPQEIDSQLDPHHTFSNYIEGDSNRLSRSVGLSIAEHPNSTQFNPMFVYGPSGCGKTHLINAIGVRTKELYPQKRVLYVSARLFQVQYTNAVLQNRQNDFIAFYQTIDVLIVDDIQEWMTAPKTQQTFFHIFDHLFRNGKRIIVEKPNTQLCVDILNSKIKRDGLKIPADVVQYIAETANGSVRDLEGVINSLLAYSIVDNASINLKLAERIVKRAVKVDDKPLTIDDIVESVCRHYNVSESALSSKSRRHEIVLVRQISMYLAQKYTKLPASRIGKLVGGRDHSTVIHSCNTISKRLQVDTMFKEELSSIEQSFKIKK